jgi:acyl-lipid omega-6 desaturase (Delta-12 desaturase)
MTHIAAIKLLKRTIIARYARQNNASGFLAVATTLLPLAALWYAAVLGAQVSYWLIPGVIALMSLFLVRVFVLMHECGHGSLFRNARLNKVFGFVFGVLAAMPQYVWSRHHLFHHSTNGNWDQYRGPLDIATVGAYAAMTGRQQRRYRQARSIWLAPLGGFVYLLANPRLTWLWGSMGLLGHIARSKIAQPAVSLREHARSFKTRHWASGAEYWHMFWNNMVLFGLWALMAWLVGPALFVVCYVASISLAGGAGIVLFAVQHNFEHSYASGDEDWSSDHAAIDGTSFLVLPRWLRWFTANIGFHHIHHLSARIPFYRLVACHAEYQHLFSDVTRVRIAQIPSALKSILWEPHARRIISVAEYERCRPSFLAA